MSVELLNLLLLIAATDEDSFAYKLGYFLGPVLIVGGIAALIVWLVRRSQGPKQPPLQPPPGPGQVYPAAQPAPASAQVPAGWFPDPHGEKRLRYWDGATWTGHTAD